MVNILYVIFGLLFITGASSSCSGSSGPVYIRPPGFRFHAQEITRPKIKKKKKVFSVTNTTSNSKTPGSFTQGAETTSILRKREPTPPKHRHIKRGESSHNFIYLAVTR